MMQELTYQQDCSNRASNIAEVWLCSLSSEQSQIVRYLFAGLLVIGVILFLIWLIRKGRRKLDRNLSALKKSNPVTVAIKIALFSFAFLLSLFYHLSYPSIIVEVFQEIFRISSHECPEIGYCVPTANEIVLFLSSLLLLLFFIYAILATVVFKLRKT